MHGTINRCECKWLCTVLSQLLLLYLQTKEYLEDPSKFASAAPVVAAPTEKKEEKVEKAETESEDEDMGFGLFD